ncbi:MAG TPA: DUF454 domain-containing protein [Dehalococcoidia bacterium]|nr:DUF454 domain-containing protein [Dehalococcoidia bacterium]
MPERLKRQLLIIAGTACVATGVIGIFVPILPTTPFLLLAAFCYMRSSPRFHRWLMNNRLFGAYIRSYTEGRGIPLRLKLFTIALLWATIGISIWLAANLAVTIILPIIAAAVTIHIALIRAKPKG